MSEWMLVYKIDSDIEKSMFTGIRAKAKCNTPSLAIIAILNRQTKKIVLDGR